MHSEEKVPDYLPAEIDVFTLPEITPKPSKPEFVTLYIGKGKKDKINKIDIAPYVHSDLGVMDRDTKAQRGDRPYVFTNLFDGTGLDRVIKWVKEDMLFEDA